MRALLLVAALVCSLSAQAAEWIDQLDIPLMPGLALDAEQETVFETATGRVVVMAATGPVASDAVRRYYAGALPGLGWVTADNRRFLREAERLEIEIERRDGQTVVAFSLAPR